MKAVLDPNVIISAGLSSRGAPAEALRMWRGGLFEVVVSPSLLAELARALAYPKIRGRIAAAEAAGLVSLFRSEGLLLADPAEPPSVRSVDPGDDYLIALAGVAHAVLVSGDRHLLDLAGRIPVFTPRAFSDLVGAVG